MLQTALSAEGTLISRVDPRLRILGALLFSVAVALCTGLPAAGFALAAGLFLAVLARLPGAVLPRRLGPLNLTMLGLLVLLPLSAPGQPLWSAGPVRFSAEGAALAVLIAVKANAILLGLTALMSTIEAVRLGHALQQLRCPAKLTQLFLFTVRYLDVLHAEYVRLARAMRARAFTPRLCRHTLHSYGYLAGMLLVRAFDRSERIQAAMKCRGFRGRYPAVAPDRPGAADAVFALAMLAVVALIALGERW